MDSATIVAASLSDKELRDSVTKLVNYFDDQMKIMAVSTNITVDSIEKKLKSLGSIKIDSGGTADGGSSRRTSKQKEGETQVKATTQAYKEQKSVVGELAMSFDNLNTAITKSNSKLAAKFDVTEQQKVQQLEAQRAAIEDKIVARQIEIDESYRSQLATLAKTRSELESKANLTSKEQADLKHVTTEWERINKIVRDISSRPIVAADDPTGSIWRLQQQLVETNKQLDESRKRIQEMNFERAKMYDGSLSGLIQNAQATMKYQNDTLKKSFEDLLKKPTHDVDEMRAKMERLQTFLNNIKPLNIFSPELIANGERAINKLKNEIQKFNDNPTKQAFADALKLPDRKQGEILTKIRNIRDAIKSVEGTKIVSETEIARAKSLLDSLHQKLVKLYNAPKDRQLRIDFADALKMPTNNIDEIAAKLMRLQYILQEMRGMEVLSPQQIANGNQQISALLSKLEAEMSLRQQINAVQQADMQNAQKRIELEAKYGEEVAKAAAIANDWLQKSKETAILNKEGTFVVYDPKSGQAVGQSIEAQLLAYKAINGELNLELEVQKAIQNTVESIERAEQRRIALAQGGNAASNKSFADYEDLRTAIAAVLRVRESEVSLANSEDASYKALSLTLKQLKQAYESLDASQRKSENADVLIASIHETQRAMQEIQKQMSRPVNLASALALPEKNIDDISYKVQMLRAYAQGINIETNAGNAELRRVMSTIEGLNEGLKNAQKTAKQITIESNNIKFDNIAKVPTEGLKQVGAKIKEVKQYINELKNQPIVDEKNLKRAEALYDRLIKQSQKLNDTKGTHSNVNDALNVRVKTLDEIAKKMQRLQSIRQNLDISKQKADIDRINAALGELKKQQDGVLQRNANMIKSNNTLGRSWNYMKNRLAFYFTVGASTQFIKNLIEVRSQYEMNERALGILINSAERGTQIFNELSQMALVSPYTLIELSTAAKQLTAYDVAAKDVVDTTRRLADMAAAVGIPIERLTYALGQIKAYGYLNARDARMFANAGIPLVKQLSEYYTELEGRLVSTTDIYDRIKKKSIGYEEVTSVIARMTDEGGKFYDFQAKMAETLKVQLANLTLAWNNMLNAMGEESQGVLVGSISTLKQVFLHWKDIEHVLYELIVAFGAYKAYQIITTRLMGATAASLDAQVLAIKRNNAAMLEKQALTRKLTVDELGQVAAQKMVTAADYQNALSGKQLTKQKALLLAAIYKNNVQLKAALVNMGLLTTAEATSITRGKALAIVFKSIGISIKNAALAIRAFAASMWPLLVMGAIYELYHAWDSYGEHVKEVNKQATEHAKEAFENIKQYLESESTINTRQRVVYKEGNPLTDAESQKAWDEMREKIELSSSASNTFIAKLMQIDNINNRLAAGFDYLKDVQRVAGVMQTLEEDAVGVSSTTLGGLFGEGLKDDLVDFINAYQKYISLNENLKQGVVGENYFNEQKKALEEFRGEVEKTTTSLYNIASKEGFNTNEQREFLEREISEIAQAEQMGAKETRIFRMQAEKEYYTYARAQLVAQLEYQDGAQKALTQKRINDLDNEFGKSKALQEGFFTWLTEKQDHAVKNMLRGKTLEEIEQGEWLKGANAKWVEEMARKFSKEYGVSFDDLHKLVLNANTWSINIPVFFQTIGQPLSDVQRDYEARTGKKFSNNPIIKDAKTQVDIIDTLKKKQKEVANEMETARKAGGKYWEDNKQRYKEENDALVADIHAYNALTDAEEKANKKSGKGSSKKDPLLDALKQEISLVEKLQSDYDKLSKSGASQTDALDTIRGAYGKTIRLLNTQLQSYGLPQIDISQLITGKDPNKTLNHFKQTLDTLVSKGMLTLERSKELEAVVEKFTLSAKTYNLDKITKGLNNELDRLKEEYELAVSLDADPELGNMFADWMGIDVNDLPRTASEYAERASKELNKYLKENKTNVELPNLLNITDDDMRAFEENKTLTDTQIEIVGKRVQQAREIYKKEVSDQIKDWDKLLEKYAEYQTKVNKIHDDAVKERVSFAQQFAKNEEDKSIALKLQTQILAATDPQEKQRLIQQLQELVKKIAGDDKTKINLVTAINNNAQQGVAKANFEEYQKSPEWIAATGDLAGMTTKAIGYLISSLEKYKKTAKNLDPKQIKQINSALRNLHRQQRQGNPFLQIADAIDRAKERADEFKPEMKKVKDEIAAIEKEIGDNEATEEQAKQLKTLKERWEELASMGEVSATEYVNAINSCIAAASQAISMFTDMADALGGKHMTDATKTIKDVVSVLDKAGQGAALGAQIGGGWGALIGGVAGGLTGLISTFADQWSGNAAITEKVEESVRAVKRLENAYRELEFATENAFGTAVAGANQAMKANKELQLVELKRQLALEQSRSSKNKDEDKIIDLTGQIIDLENEISKATSETLNNLLGISSHGDFFEDMISDMISAFKNGEDAMKVFEEKWADMIDNMIMKTIVSQVLQNWVNSLENGAQKILDKYTAEPSKAVADLTKQMTDIYSQDASDISEWIYVNDREAFEKILNSLGVTTPNFDKGPIFRSAWFDEALNSGLAQKIADAYKNMLGGRMDTLSKNLDKASLDATGDLIDYYSMAGEDFKENYLGLILDKIQENWNFGQDSETQLSSLQQGLQSMSEDTAGALEAYMNGVSQQVYLQSDLLTQIRDAVVGFDLDVQVATMSQILLQLQSSYTVQMSIQGILEGVLNPSGRAFTVELLS